MFSHNMINEEHQQENYTIQRNNSVLQGEKIERRRISTVGNFYNFANSLTTTETKIPITIAKPSIHSGHNESVVASVSMSLEREDSIQYIVNPCSKFKSNTHTGPQFHPSCIIPPGQNTVIHIDNYTKFMAQRVTTTRTDVKTSVEISKELPTTLNKQLEGEVKRGFQETQSSTCISENSPLDIDVQVIFGGSAKNTINKKTLTMHKQKMLASKSLNTPSKLKNRNESLALDSCIMPPPATSKKTIKKPRTEKTESSNKSKSMLKKPKRTRQKKVKEPKATSNPKQKHLTKAVKQVLARDEGLVPTMSHFTQTEKSPKILKPCVNLLQDKKCPNQLTCQYMHSDFPCKYYYYNLSCPDGTKCQFMHNGPLSPQLKSALQTHLVDLLSGAGKSPTETECLFIQQMQHIEDLSIRLKEFQNKGITSGEVIELVDDDDDDGDHMLVIDESIGEVKKNDLPATKISSLNPLQNIQQTQPEESLPLTNTPLSLNPLQNPPSPQQVLALVPARHHKLDSEFKIYKDVNTVLGKIEDNLQNLKKSDKTADEKNKELINIYELLMNQEKLLPIKPTKIDQNYNNDIMEPLLAYKIPVEQTSCDHEGQPHIILVDPEIVNDIQTTNSQDSFMILTDDEYTEANVLNVPPQLHDDIEKLLQFDDSATNKEVSAVPFENDNTLSLENVKSMENQETQIIYSSLLEKENRETITNISTTIQEMIDNNNITLEQISTNPPQNNITEKISKPLTPVPPESEVTDCQSPVGLNSEESQQQDNANILPTKITNISEDEKENRKSLPEILISKQYEQIENNSLNLNMEAEEDQYLQYNSIVSHEDVTESITDDVISTSLDSEEPQPSCSEISNINTKTTTIGLVEENIEENLQQQQQMIDNNNSEQNSISPSKISSFPQKEINEIISHGSATCQETEMVNTKPSSSLLNEEDQGTLTLPQIPDMIDHNKEQTEENSETPSDDTSTLELGISSDEKDIIEGNDDEESPPFEKITSLKALGKTFPKASPRSRIRLRSHTVHEDNEEIDVKANSQVSEISTTIEPPVKPIKKFRRLRLPKPLKKPIEKSSTNDCKIDAEIINKLIDEPKEKPTPLLHLEAPITQNVIITNRFLKKAKSKLCHQLKQADNINETSDEIVDNENSLNNDTKNVELNMFALHHENYELTICTQTSSDGSQSLAPSQDPLMEDNDSIHHNENSHDDINALQKCNDEVETKSMPSHNTNKNVIQNIKRSVSFETTSSSPNGDGKQCHVVLTKLKPSLLPTISTQQKQMQADSTTSSATTSVVVSSSTASPINTAAITICSSSTSVTLLTGDTSSHALGRKRRSFTPESDLDSSLKADKLLKVTNTKCTRKVNLKRSSVEHSSDKDDFNTDSSDEKPTKADALQSSSSSTDNERTFQPSTSIAHHVVSKQQQQHHHHHVHHDEQRQQQEQQENVTDLRQQIENVSNKSDLQLQSQSQSQQQQQQQQHQLQMQKEIETATTTTTSTKNSNDLPHIQQNQQEHQQQQKQIEKEKIVNTCNTFNGNTSTQQQLSPPQPLKHIEVNGAKPTPNLSNKYPNEVPMSPAIFDENIKGEEENTEMFKYSSLYNKLSSHTARRQINFENSSINITPIASPTYLGGDNTIASPSPVRGDTTTFDIRLGGEIDGRMTYPPMRYILRRIDLAKNEINKPPSIDKLEKTTQLDPRIFRSHIKPTSQTMQHAATMPLKYNTTNSALSSSSSSAAYHTSSMLPYDPRNRTTAVMATSATTLPSNQTAYSCCNINPTTELVPIGDLQSQAVGVPLQHHQHQHQHQHVHHQMPAQQTPNMLLYGCLQRSPWYQSLMSTMKIQINQSISQLVRALNNFQRERLLNPDIVFDIFKIDIAAELLEIMRNLGIFVDANGIINEQRHVPAYAGRSCLGAPTTPATIPVNATYSFIQQVLTPTTLGPSMMTTASSSTYNAATGTGGAINEPFVSCYIEAPKLIQVKHHQEEVVMPRSHSQSPHDDNGNNVNNNSGGNYNNNNYNQKRSNNQFKKPYDNNNSQNSQQRGSYSQNPRFNRSYQNSESNSPTRSSPPPLSPRGNGGGSGNSRGGGRGGGGGGRYNNNNNRRFNNNNNYGASSSRSSTSPPPPSQGFNNRNNRSYNSNNSPTKTSSPPQSYGQYRNSMNKNNSSSSPPSSYSSTQQKLSPTPAAQSSKPGNDEEDWD